MGRKHSSPYAGNGNGTSPLAYLNDAPWYVKVGIWFIIWFGFPVVVSSALFGIVVGYIPSPMMSAAQDIREHREETRAVFKYMEASSKTLRQICRNTSTNKIEQLACDQ